MKKLTILLLLLLLPIMTGCILSSNAVFWVRDGEKRYSYQLNNKVFEQGKLYPVKIEL